MSSDPKDQNVLLVEDVASIHMVVQSLIGESCRLTCVESLKAAEEHMNRHSFSLLLLDVSLPDGDGFNFCQKLRAQERFRALPIMFLTGKDQIEDRVRGFENGADDYIVKPIEPKEFIARVHAKLRLSGLAQNSEVKKGGFRLDNIAQKGYLKNEAGVEIDLALTPIEFKLLNYFLRNEGQVFSRDQLKTSIWGPSVFVSGHTLDTHIYSTRKKIAPYGKCLKAVVKQGYCFKLD